MRFILAGIYAVHIKLRDVNIKFRTLTASQLNGLTIVEIALQNMGHVY